MEHKVFGCKVNKYYLNKWLAFFAQEKNRTTPEYKNFDPENSLLIATCVVTDRAKAKRIKVAKKALDEGKTVFLTGCGAFDRGRKIAERKFYTTYPDLVPYREDIILLGEEPDSDTTREVKTNTFKKGVNIFTRKFVIIQNGCDSYCTFCLTVQKRGNHRTIPLKEIIEQINDFTDIGGQEVVLTGINLSAWGNPSTNDWQDNQFGKMLKELLYNTDIPRIRISSLGPEFLDKHFFEAIENPRFIPHFHFSIQSFSTGVLQRMRRHYDYDHLKAILTKTRAIKKKLPISIGADIISSFPGETEEEFQTTLQAIKEFGITKLHAFPFSPHRRGDKVPAGFFENQIDDTTKRQRQQAIIDLGDEVRKNFIKENYGLQHHVLLEGQKDGYWHGRSENYINIKIKGNYKRGQVVPIILSEENLAE